MPDLRPPLLASLLALASCTAADGTGGPDAGAFADGLARLKGRSIGAAYAALGRPDSARPVHSGGYVIAWNRDAAAPAGTVTGWRECTLLGAVTARGILSDFMILGDPQFCAETFKPLP